MSLSFFHFADYFRRRLQKKTKKKTQNIGTRAKLIFKIDGFLHHGINKYLLKKGQLIPFMMHMGSGS